MIGEGEKSIIQYIKYAENKLQRNEVSGLVYKENNIIKRNNIIPIKDINEIQPPSYDGVDFKKYFNRNYIAIEFAKGCYWHKCAFCYNNLWKKYHIKSPQKAVDILEYLSKKYNITFFSILDDALNVNFAEKFAEEIIKRGLNITYNCFLRAEEYLTYEILEKLKKSGVKQIFFGIESASEGILELMNKGIKLDNAERILKDCYEIGIETDVGFMYGFPTETEEDVLKTINFIKKNRKYITREDNFVFHITKSSAMLTEENIKKLQLTNIKQPEEFSDDISYDAPGISREKIYKIFKENNLIYSKHTKWV